MIVHAQWNEQSPVLDAGRYGHNELDDPKATLPLEYLRIEKHASVLEQYSENLEDAGLVSQAEVAEWQVGCCGANHACTSASVGCRHDVILSLLLHCVLCKEA